AFFNGTGRRRVFTLLPAPGGGGRSSGVALVLVFDYVTGLARRLAARLCRRRGRSSGVFDLVLVLDYITGLSRGLAARLRRRRGSGGVAFVLVLIFDNVTGLARRLAASLRRGLRAGFARISGHGGSGCNPFPCRFQ